MGKRFDQLGATSKAVVLDLFCARFCYAGDAQGNPVAQPGETKVQFATRMCQEWIVREALAQRATSAASAAAVSGASDADLT